MEVREFVRKKTGLIIVGELVGTAIMCGVFAVLDAFDHTVLLGGIVGIVLAVLNFIFMAISVSTAADKAVEQDVSGGKAAIKSSFLIRLLVLFVVLVVCAKSGICNAIAMAVPLFLVRPIITITEFFGKAGKKDV